MRPQRERSLSVLPFSPPSVLPLLGSSRDFVKTFFFVPDFQTAQFSLFTFHRFVTSGVVVVVFIAQISHHHWGENTGTTVDDCHNVRLHLCIIWEQMLLCGQFFLKACEAHGEKDGQSHA